MKKTKLQKPKLNLGRKTISNLSNSEMKRQMGGAKSNGNNCTNHSCFTCGHCGSFLI
jgi:hypothetical protein